MIKILVRNRCPEKIVPRFDSSPCLIVPNMMHQNVVVDQISRAAVRDYDNSSSAALICSSVSSPGHLPEITSDNVLFGRLKSFLPRDGP